MATEAKIAVLLRSLEVDEQRLSSQRLSIQQIVEERKVHFEACMVEIERITRKLAEGNKKLRESSLQQGNVGALAEWERFSKRLQRELEAIEPRRTSTEKELRSAQQRLTIVDEEIVALRLERKRIERIIENREVQERIQTQALDEAASDDMNIYKNRK